MLKSKKMTDYWFIAVEQFGPGNGERWGNYVSWAKLPQLREVVSLDALMCPPVFGDSRFSFCGYDLIEEGSGVSTDNNCGGFGKVFKNKDVSEVGLIEHYDLARSIQNRLLELYPEEIHAHCDLWAIWRMGR